MPQRYSAVYILYPRGVRTGGPEALHQLTSTLRELGTPAFLVPFANTVSSPRVAEYEQYDAPEAPRVQDQPGNAVVAPEVRYLDLAKYRRADRFCWWLSIDNSQLFLSQPQQGALPADSLVRQMRRLARKTILPLVRPIALRLPVHHLSQSAYARDFLYSRAGLLSSMLSDYVSLPKDTAEVGPERNPRQIAFNFAKGGDLVQRVIDSNAVDADWVPIVNMSPADVNRTLQSSAIYIDLGHQPGKDRLPREAAASGAVTLVARRGAGASNLDFPLPPDHKLDASYSNTESVSVTLNAILADLTHQYNRQSTFRNAIILERQTFVEDVRRIFINGIFE